jgi:putative hydrolase of the HAD superfamily
VIKWVVFDLGDVVLKHTNALAGLSALMASEPDGFTEAYFRHRPAYDRHSDAGAFWTSIATSTGSNVPDAVLIEELVRVDDIGWSEVEPEIQQLISDIADSGTALAVLSNAPSSMGRLVEGAPWAAAFQRLFFSGDLGLLKPDREIYLHLLESLGAAAQDVAFLDDRADNIAGAIAAGIHGFVFTDAAQARADLRSVGLSIPAQP